MNNKEDLIKAIREIDREALLEKNPRRPFDNAKTLDLFTEEVIILINEHQL